ncbi:MAG: hypothetical protein P4L33_03780 [Capsulimonadaceae bacterium]|nr:hypothetical protein [Capsulimonadaceae bacterium]
MNEDRIPVKSRRGQGMGYWLNEPSIQDPRRIVSGVNELAEAGYKIIRVMLRNTNYTHLSPEVVAAVSAGAHAAVSAGVRLVLDCEPHTHPVVGEMARMYPGSTSARLVPVQGRVVRGQFSVSVPAPRVEAKMPVWAGIECAFVRRGDSVTPLRGLQTQVLWETQMYAEGDTRASQPFRDGFPCTPRFVCRIDGHCDGASDGEILLYARFDDILLPDFWAPGFRQYYADLLNAYRSVPLAGVGWDEPAVSGNWDCYRYGEWFAKAFAARNGYALADRAYLLDWPAATPEAVRVRLDYYDTLNQGLLEAQAAVVAQARSFFGDNCLLGTHHTWQGEGGINDYRAGAVDYFRLGDSMDAGYTDCCWWDEKAVSYVYALASALGRLSPSGEAEVNTWHWKPTNALVRYHSRLMSLFNVCWFNIWSGDSADTCHLPSHYTWSEMKSSALRHDAVQERLHGLTPVVDVAVWHGWEGVAALNDAAIANAHKTCVMNLAHEFTLRNIAFDFVDSRLLAASTIDGDDLVNVLGRYRVLILPYAAVLPDSAWRTCQAFAAAGGRIVFTGPPPAIATDGRDLAEEFRSLAGLDRAIGLDEYLDSIRSRYQLPNRRADALDCVAPLDSYAGSPLRSVEGEAHGVASLNGRVVYLSDLDPRARLIDAIEPWLRAPIRCHCDAALWRAYRSSAEIVVVIVARDGRRLDGIVEADRRLLRLKGGELALVSIRDGNIAVVGDNVSWEIIEA